MIILRLFLLFVPAFSPAHAQESENCSKSGVQNLCPRACSSLCREDVTFRQANQSFCASALSRQGEDRDDEVCPDILPGLATTNAKPSTEDNGAPATTETASERETFADTAAEENCDRFESRSEQLRCIQNSKGRPTCSATAVALEDDASLLVTEVRQELEQYGDLLAEDLTDIASRDRLCEFSRDELDTNYKRATQDPEALRTIQRRADNIQHCRGEWEEYLRKRATSPDISDIIVENTAEASRAQFQPLIEQLEKLSSSIIKLEQAASTIDGLIIIHNDFCRAEGTRAAANE